MARSNRILAVVPARGASKAIPRKNLIPICGRPLIAYTIDAGLASNFITRVIVSTEDEEIATVAAELGADVPFRRPDELAEDRVLSLPVVQHAVEAAEAEEGLAYDIIVLLQPTTPLRTASDIDEGIALLLKTGVESVVSVVNVGSTHPYRMKRIDESGRLVNFVEQGFEDMRPRQLLPPVYIRSGALYASWRPVVMEQNTLVGRDCRPVVIPEERAVDIDTPLDLLRAEQLLCGK